MKYLSIIIFITIATISHAENFAMSLTNWERTGGALGEGVEQFMTLDGIDIQGNTLFLWEYVNIKDNPQIKNTKSALARIAFDCSNKRFKKTEIWLYEDFDLQGRSVYEDMSRMQFKTPPPNTPYNHLIKTICPLFIK